MMHRVLLYLTIASLLGLALISVLVDLLWMFRNPNIAVYTPLGEQVFRFCELAGLVLRPAACVSLSAYLFSLERLCRSDTKYRGFEVGQLPEGSRQ